MFRLNLRPNGRFAELNVGKVILKVRVELDTLRIVHDPLEADANHKADVSHAEVRGLPPGNTDQAALVGDLIAECITQMHPATAEHPIQEA
ncbi:hypothetical protein [Candidatus Foliamicus sp.]